jgi:hypothetical protein
MKQTIALILGLSFALYAGQRVPTGSQSLTENSHLATALAPAKLPYLGKWSNGRGESLTVTTTTLRFNSDRAATYRDVTKVTDGNHFSLEITSRGKLNYFTRFIALEVNGSEMKMTLYNSSQDMFDGNNLQGESTWERDK